MMFSTLLEHDQDAAGFTIAQVAWRIGVTPAVYPELEAGTRSPASIPGPDLQVVRSSVEIAEAIGRLR